MTEKKHTMVFKMMLISLLITAPIVVIMSVYEVNVFIDKAALYLENTLLKEKISVHEKLSDLSSLIDDVVSKVASNLANGESIGKFQNVIRIEISSGEVPSRGRGFRVVRKVIINNKVYNLYIYIDPRVMEEIIRDEKGNLKILVVSPEGKVALPPELSGKSFKQVKTTLGEMHLRRLANLLRKYDIKLAEVGGHKYYLMRFQSPVFSGYKVFLVMNYQKTVDLIERNLSLAAFIDLITVFGIGLLVFIYVRNLTFPVQHIIEQLKRRRIERSLEEISVEVKSEELQDMVNMINDLFAEIRKSLEEVRKREEKLKTLHEKVLSAKNRLVKIDALINDLMTVSDRRSVIEMALKGVSNIFNEIVGVYYEFEGERGKETVGVRENGIPFIVTVDTENGEHRFHIYTKTSLNDEQIGMLDIFLNIVIAAAENKDLWNQIEQSYFYLTQKLAEISEVYDDETGQHIKRVGEYSALVAKELGMESTYVEKIRMFSQLHDIGKLKIPREILMKPGKLTPEEFEIMKKHTIYGAEFLGEQPWLKMARNVALYHHENWDGTGYPFGLRGKNIPLEARIVKIADVYDALRSRRSYKPSLSHEEAVRIILSGDGRTMPSHFDPDVLGVFKRAHLKFNEIFEINRG